MWGIDSNRTPQYKTEILGSACELLIIFTNYVEDGNTNYEMERFLL